MRDKARKMFHGGRDSSSVRSRCEQQTNTHRRSRGGANTRTVISIALSLMHCEWHSMSKNVVVSTRSVPDPPRFLTFYRQFSEFESRTDRFRFYYTHVSAFSYRMNYPRLKKRAWTSVGKIILFSPFLTFSLCRFMYDRNSV